MNTKVQKWGKSLGVRIPKALAQDLRLEEGARVDLVAENGRLSVTPVQKKAYSLKDLLGGVTRDNLHGEIDAGSAVGREVW